MTYPTEDGGYLVPEYINPVDQRWLWRVRSHLGHCRAVGVEGARCGLWRWHLGGHEYPFVFAAALRPPSTIRIPKLLTDEEAQGLKERWLAMMRGPRA